MTEVEPPEKGDDSTDTESELQSGAPLRIPQYRRDLFPANCALSAEDLSELVHLVSEANERAKRIEIANLDFAKFESEEHARRTVNDLMVVEYNYEKMNGDLVQGIGIPNTKEHSFPEELKSFFVSNATYAQRAANVKPLNAIDIFLGFERPSLKLDLQTLPSNPTENRSVINVYGRDEDWVISTADRINDFLRRKRTFRPIIHGSGTYDYFIYLAFIPAIIWIFYRNKESELYIWLQNQSVFLNVVLGIYIFLLSLLLARFIFQYVRWLFPPMEYFKNTRFRANLHRLVASIIGSSILLGALYDLIKSIVIYIL